jgi:hypothetical protein
MRIVGTSRISQSPPRSRRDGTAVPEASDAIIETTAPRRTAPPTSRLARPDPYFIIQLIATAEQSPQTRSLRRAETAEVDAAYRAVANRRTAVAGVTRRMA